MKKILFLIHDLGQGGAEKVLVNLVNNMDRSKFDISVTVLFGGGVNEQFLAPDIHYHAVFPRMIPGNSKWMKLFTPRQLHKICVKDAYDIEVAYLEGPSARVISGCQNKDTRLVSWIHSKQSPTELLAQAFRSVDEASLCYSRFHRIVCVSEDIKQDFCKMLNFQEKCIVLYNTIESNYIIDKSKDNVEILKNNKIKMVAVGSLKEIKGFDRLLRITKRLKDEKYNVHLYLLGIGPLQSEFEKFIKDNELRDTVTLLGYQTNPYKYVAKCDLFVCSSHSEGFSTAATEALIVGTPVCTVEVSGMREMLGSNNEHGVVTENNEDDLYQGIKQLLDDSDLLQHYKNKAIERGKAFNKKSTTNAVEQMLLHL